MNLLRLMLMKKLVIYILLIFFFVGCTPAIPKQNPFFYVASTREINVKNLDLTKLPKRENVVGKVCYPCLGAPFYLRGCEPSIATAIEDALQNGNGDLLLDSNLSIDGFLFVMCTSVRGTVVNTKEAK